MSYAPYIMSFMLLMASIGSLSASDSITQKWYNYCSDNAGIIAGAATLGGLYIANALFNQPVKASLDVDKFNVITFIPGEQHDAEFFDRAGLGICCENGIKGILEKLRLGQPIDTQIRVSNTKLKKERIVHVFSGVPQKKKIIFIYSGGWIVGACGRTSRSDGFTKDNVLTPSCGVGLHLVNRYMRFGILNGTTVTFDYPTDTRRAFTAGQEDDLICLKKVYDEVAKHNPDAHIVLVGDCKGGTTILNLISHPLYYNQLPQVKGVLVESPPASIKHVAYNIADRWLWALPGSKHLVHGLFKFAMPAYDSCDQVHSILNAKKEHIPADLPIFIGRIQNDDIANDMIIEDMIQKLKENGNQKVHLYTTSEKIMHARLGKVAEYQQAANDFFKKYGFPYNEILAKTV